MIDETWRYYEVWDLHLNLLYELAEHDEGVIRAQAQIALALLEVAHAITRLRG